MEIHKPKPAHSWREFAVELGTIVLGILIALGLEQVAERFKEQRVAHEAREAVRLEAEKSLGLVKLRQSNADCLSRRFGEIDTILNKAQLHRAFERPRWIGRPRLMPLPESSWNAASQAGRVALFSPEEQASYAEIYVRVGQLKPLLEREELLWATLRELENPVPLTDRQLDRLRDARTQAGYLAWRINFISDRMLLAAEPLHLTPAPPDKLGFVSSLQHPSMCLAIDTPREKALAIIDNPSGEP